MTTGEEDLAESSSLSLASVEKCEKVQNLVSSSERAIDVVSSTLHKFGIALLLELNVQVDSNPAATTESQKKLTLFEIFDVIRENVNLFEINDVIPDLTI